MPSKPQMAILSGDNTFGIEVAGESHYAQNLRKIAGSCDHRDVDVVKTAYLGPEPSNKYDPNAIRVFIDDLQVGYLPRATAAQLAPVLRRTKLAGVQLQARIRAFEGASNYSVWLDGDLSELETVTTGDRPWWRFW